MNMASISLLKFRRDTIPSWSKKSGYRSHTVRLVTVRPGETVTLPDVKISTAAKR